mmetsp:Transcript_1781/g.4146  ORF Transcript_1781/g.4146 Transcript_1781/m.4146 type:complete len:207 (+) Transcript_1781:706-1326(+)
MDLCRHRRRDHDHHLQLMARVGLAAQTTDCPLRHTSPNPAIRRTAGVPAALVLVAPLQVVRLPARSLCRRSRAAAAQGNRRSCWGAGVVEGGRRHTNLFARGARGRPPNRPASCDVGARPASPDLPAALLEFVLVRGRSSLRLRAGHRRVVGPLLLLPCSGSAGRSWRHAPDHAGPHVQGVPSSAQRAVPGSAVAGVLRQARVMFG